MKVDERQAFLHEFEPRNNPLLSIMSSLIENNGLPACLMALGDLSKVLSEAAE